MDSGDRKVVWKGIDSGDSEGHRRMIRSLLDSLILKENLKDYGVADGYSGLAITFGYANRVFPNSGYDTLVYKYLKASVQMIESSSVPEPLGSFSGLTGVAIAATYAGSYKGTGNYSNLISSLDTLIFKGSNDFAAKLAESNSGIARSYFDVIAGATGIGAYLLTKDSEEAHEALEKILGSISALAMRNKDLLYLYTPNKSLFAWEKPLFSGGVVDCGMAHGLSGILSLLSLTYERGVEVDGSKEAIMTIADWLIKRAIVSEGELEWPDIVPVEILARDKREGNLPLEVEMKLSNSYTKARVAWCYGNPGTSRALFLAGRALKMAKYTDAAMSGMKAAYRRIEANWDELKSPTFCHGIAGVLEITLRFLNDTGQVLFKKKAEKLLNRLYSMYDQEAPFHYKNIDFNKKLQDDPGFLEGTAGIAATLMAAESDVDPLWDRVFLIS